MDPVSIMTIWIIMRYLSRQIYLWPVGLTEQKTANLLKVWKFGALLPTPWPIMANEGELCKKRADRSQRSIYRMACFCARSCLFGVAMIAPALKFLVALISERELTFTFAIRCRPSVCLSSVTLVRPTQAVEIFGNISPALGTLAIHWRPPGELNTRGVIKYSDYRRLYLGNGAR